jgi:hypothetical protein
MRKDKTMSTRTRASIGELFGVFGSAIAAASAVNHGRQPNARDLRALGIDPEQFGRIHCH